MSRTASSFVLGMMTGGGLLLAGLLLGGQGTGPGESPVQDVVRTRRVEIVDNVGTVRAALGSNAAGGTLSVRDTMGRTALLASASAHGGALVINSTDHKQPAFIAGADAHGGAMQVFSDAGIRVVDATGGDGGQITVASKTGVPSVRLEAGRAGVITGFDPTGRPTYRIDADDHHNGRLATFHPPSGLALNTLDSTPDHHGQIRTHAKNGRPLVLLTASSRREGQIYTRNDLGKLLIALATRMEGPTLRVYNPAGDPAVTLECNGAHSGTVGVWAAGGDGRVITP